jgi:(p)ppGpp synthase/HD superfamily hydrolase
MTQTFNTLNDAIALAKFAHFKQKDQAGFDYFEHPRRVMQAVQNQGAAPYVQMAAVLHDVTEDTAFTGKMLLDLGFSPAVVLLVDLLDRGESELFYEKAIVANKHLLLGAKDANEFYYFAIRNNAAALMIKRADIADNTLPYRLSYLPEKRQEKLRVKYAKALEILNG